MTRQAITIKYHGPTNTRGSRYIASCEVGKVTVPVDNRYNSETNAAYAVLSLLKKLDWKGNWTIGGLPSGYVAVDHSGNWEDFETTVDAGRRCFTFRDLALVNNH